RVRLTRNGLAVITLDQPIEDLPLIKCTEQILELPAQGAPQPGQDQWSIGMTILRALLDSIDRRIVLHVHGHEHEIRFTTTAQVRHTLRLDRYVIYTFRRIERDG